MDVPFNMQTLNNFSKLTGQLPVNIAAILLNIEDSQKWFNEYEETSKTTMPETKGFQIQGKKVIFRELRHCIHSNKVRQKQGNPILKKPYSSRIRNTECAATIHLRIECWHLQTTYPLEVNINFVHNHIIHCAKSLSFRRVKEEVCTKYLELFTNGHSLATALYIYEDNLYLTKRFLCLGWEAIDATKIQQTETNMEFLVPSQENANKFYIVNIKLSTCTCYIGSSRAPCKHQGAVAARYNIGLLNFLYSLTPDDHAQFAYIAHGLTANNPSFYASLHTHMSDQLEYHKHNNTKFLNSISLESEEFNVIQTQELEELNVNQTTDL
ncbi:27056_t:CDS:2, partial [Dentiscutata erythropus]